MIAGSIRVRLYLDGQLIEQETCEVTAGRQLTALAERHAGRLMRRAEAENKLWLVEVEILNNPNDPDRFMRFGTDDRGMRDPHPLFG